MMPAPELRREPGDWGLWTVRAVVVALATAGALATGPGGDYLKP
jgi:hypothetical protein